MITKNWLAHKITLGIAIFLTIAVGVLSLITPVNLGVQTAQNADKLLHATAYCTIAFNWLLVFKPFKNQLKKMLIIALVFFYGIIIEALQGVLTHYRQADYLDIVANLVGIGIALLIFNLYFQKK